MTTLSDRLHATADQLPSALPPAAQVRRHAEQRRRRTAVVGTAAGLVGTLAASAALAFGVGTDDGQTALVPAEQAGPDNVVTDEMERSATAGSYTPLADPFLTEQDWADFTGGLGISRVHDPVRPLELQAPCDERPSAESLRDSRSAQWREPGRRARQVETVLTYDDAGAAGSGLAALLKAFQRCAAQLGPAWQVGALTAPGSDPYSLSSYDFSIGPVDQAFVIERGNRVFAPDGAVPNLYQLGAARDANVVVVIESTGWGDRTHRTLAVALSRALGNQGGRCGIGGLDHRLVECPERFP